jgi:hypothetical protein
MERREFFATGVGGVLGVRAAGFSSPPAQTAGPQSIRDRFPRLGEETYLNAAAGTPLGDFAEAGLRRYLDFAQMGPEGGRAEYVGRMRSEIRGLFADLIGARPSEIGLVHCTSGAAATSSQTTCTSVARCTISWA